jgi:hypothetical protein
MGVIRKSPWLRLFANGTLVYPIAVSGLFYGEWFLAWHVLGHQPIAWENDPKYIDGSSWMHGITAVALIGILPVGAGAVFTNIMYLVRVRPTAVQAGIRLQTLVALWLAMYVLVFTDPYYPIGEWWMD